MFRVALASLIVLVGSGLAAQPAQAADGQGLSFAVLGDIHYIPPDYAVQSFVHAVADDLRGLRPPIDFVCQTGDVVEGGEYVMKNGRRSFVLSNYEEMARQWTFAMTDLTRTFPMPLFIAVGNHDKHDPGHRAYRETVLPVLGRQLERPIDENHYAFRRGNALLIFIDFAPRDMKAQTHFVEEQLRTRPAEVRHVFLFCHYPLWAVVRPGFSSPALTESLEPILKKYPIDAFFCGHTHNTVVCVRRLGDQAVTQIQGVATGKGNGLLPVEQYRTLLAAPAETSYLRGYLEGSDAGYYVVRIEGERVRVEWRRPGKGVVFAVAWQRPGELAETVTPPQDAARLTNEAELATAKEASLVFCPYAPDGATVGVSLNGQPLNDLTVRPELTPFWHEQRVPIGGEALRQLRRENKVEFSNPRGERFGIGDVRLEVVLASGARVASNVSPRFYFSCGESEASAIDRGKGWKSVPRSLIETVERGQPIRPAVLAFPVR